MIRMFTCYFTKCRLFVRGGATVKVSGCAFYIGGGNVVCIQIDESSTCYLGDRTVVDCNSAANSFGILSSGLGLGNSNGDGILSAGSTTSNWIRNCVEGIYAQLNGVELECATADSMNHYSGNTANTGTATGGQED